MVRGWWGQGAGSRWALFALLALALVGLWFGWREFWFLTDDAFITFRYISNRHLGLGYVWNAPPFRPVEGYSNFLWMVLLDGIWTFFKVEPPRAANVLSLVCAGLSTWLVWRWSSTSPATSSPIWRTALALGLLLSNRTFLTWSSSGLETALFNLLLLLWVEQAWRRGDDSRRGSVGFGLLALWASLATLTRPDGLLVWAATVALAVLPPIHPQGAALPRRWLRLTGAGAALALVPLHVLWRRFTYGEWLPNTYYAKHVAPWPEAGVRYLGCFLVEYGYWAFGLLAVVVLLRRGLRKPFTRPSLFRLLAVGTLLAQTAYYVLRVGGDHFEYRVLSQWVPLIALAWASLLAGLPRLWIQLAAIALSLLASLPIQWAHWASSRVLTTRSQTWKMKVRVAPRLGPLWAPVAEWFDGQQAWLIDHHVCMRHQEHKVFGEEQRRSYPSRGPVDAPKGELPVIALGTVGVPGWALPNVAVVDVFGLNDYVIARNPVFSGHFRLMAHDRAAPPGYLDCFRPNVDVDPQGVARAHPRPTPLTGAEVAECERDFLALVRGEQEPLPAFADKGTPVEATPLSPEAFDALAQGGDVLFREDFDGSPGLMEKKGGAFGEGRTSRQLPSQQPISGARGGYLNSYHRGDLSTGMISFALPPGTRRLALKVAGGASCQSVFAGVVAGDRLLAKACGRQSEALEAVLLTLEGVEGEGELRFVAFDGSREGWGHLIVDDVIALGAAP